MCVFTIYVPLLFPTDNRKIISLQSELHDKSLLLGKVKTLLERAALKERELIEQVSVIDFISLHFIYFVKSH